MRVEILPCLKDNYSYIIIDKSNNLACVIDPSESEPIIDFVENNNIKLKYILNTHHHFDHIGGNKELKKRFGSTILGFKGDSHRIPEIDILLEDNQTWKAENFVAKMKNFYDEFEEGEKLEAEVGNYIDLIKAFDKFKKSN